MADRHDLALGAGGRDLELLRDDGRSQGVVTAGLELLRQPGEDAAAVVANRARLAVDELLRRPDLAAEGLDQCLVAEADAKSGHAGGEPFDDLDRGARVGGPPRTGRDDELRPREALGLVGADRVVAMDDNLAAELAEHVHEVISERVVVVDEKDHSRASASSIASSSAASLRRHSLCSAAGSESATIPAPACRRATPSWRTIVRIGMRVSSVPSGSA